MLHDLSGVRIRPRPLRPCALRALPLLAAGVVLACVDPGDGRARVAGARTARAPAADSQARAPEARPVGPTLACRVKTVHDGDTIRCADGTRVRLLLVDAPEMDQGPFGRASRDTLRRLVLGKDVTLETDVQRADRYGRLLAYVWLDGRLVNTEMARRGMVVQLTYPPNVRHVERVRAAVEEARAARRGLWREGGFSCPPVEHRRGRC
jgi:micrococcal nuclease